jgi:hypothetical protein
VGRLFQFDRRRSAAAADDVDAELHFHLEERVSQLVARGWTPEAAAAEARRRFGPSYDEALRALRAAGTRREDHLAMRDRLDSLRQDLRFALRTLRRAPTFALTAILTLAFGLGALTTLFAVVRGVLLRPLPYAEPRQLVQLWTVTSNGDRVWFTDPDFADVARQARSFQALAQFQGARLTVAGGAQAERVGAAFVSRDFPRVLGVRPLAGRWFAPDEQAPGAARTVVVSEAFWRRALGVSPDLRGRTILLDGEPHAVIGVFPAGFDFPDGTDVWLPRERRAPNTSRTAHNWKVVARLRPGVAPASAGAEVSAIARGIRREFGADANMRDARVVPLLDETVGEARTTLLLLLGGAALLVCIATGNVLMLLLARAEARRRELGVRIALGAARGRLVRQFLVEAGALAVGGTLGAVGLAWAATRLLTAVPPAALPRPDAVRLDAAVLGFATTATLAIVLVLGAVTGWRATRGAGTSRGGGRRRAGAGTGAGWGAESAAALVGPRLLAGDRSAIGGREAARGRGVLVGVQVALTAVLLVGAGLLAHSYQRLTQVAPGFRTRGPVTVALSFPSAEDTASALRQRATVAELRARLRTLRGVRVVGAVNIPAPAGGRRGLRHVHPPDARRRGPELRRLRAPRARQRARRRGVVPAGAGTSTSRPWASRCSAGAPSGPTTATTARRCA